MYRRHGFCAVLLIVSSVTSIQAAFKATADFEGGSARFLSIDAERQSIVFVPGGERTRGWPCWWWFQVDGIKPGSTVVVTLEGRAMQGISSAWAMPGQATFSMDGGKTWKQTSPGKRDGTRMTWSVPIDSESAQFAWGPPFVPSDATALVQRIAAKHDFAQAFELCKTRAGRSVPALRIKGSQSLPVVWVHARQHAWESGSSWVCRGLVEWLCGDSQEAVALRGQREFVIVPIMDIDSAATGNGGKGQVPQDHNRDWSDAPHWPAVAAAAEQILAYAQAKRFDLFVDLHNPAPSDHQPFFFTVPRQRLTELGRKNLDRFVAECKEQIIRPMKLSDRRREVGPDYDKNAHKMSQNWVQAHTLEHVVAVTLETSWNTPHSTTDGYQTVGRQLGIAISRFVGTPSR